MLALNVLKEKQCRQLTSSVETACYFPIKKNHHVLPPIVIIIFIVASSTTAVAILSFCLYILPVTIRIHKRKVYIALSLSMRLLYVYSLSVKQLFWIHEMSIVGIINENARCSFVYAYIHWINIEGWSICFSALFHKR